MKWFKHLTASGTDPDIGDLVDEMGLKGYYLFFRTLEIMAQEYDSDNPGHNLFKFCYFFDQFSRKIRREDLKKFLKITTENGRIIAKYEGRMIFLNCPKLKHLTDEYTRQKPYKNTDKVTKKVTPKIKDIKNKNTYTSNEDGFDEFWELYPRKVSKKKSREWWKDKLSDQQRKDIISAVPNYVKELNLLQRDAGHTKHPTTFINPTNEEWADYLPGVWKQPELKIGKEREETPEEYYKRQMEALK